MKNKNIKYIEIDELNSLKNKLLDKLFLDISKKYNSLLKEKEYDISKFKSLFQKEIENNFDFNNPDYKILFHSIEKLILKKLSSIDDINNKNSKDNEEIINKPIKNNNSLRKNKLTSELRRKQEDEWAKIIKYNYNQYIEEINKKSSDDKLKKENMCKELNNQIYQKLLSNEKIMLEEKKFYDEVFKKELEKLDHEEKVKKINSKNNLLKQKELLLSSISESTNKKKLAVEKEKELDKKFIEEIKRDIILVKSLAENKKKELNIMQNNILNDNMQRIKLKQENIKNEKDADVKMLELYSKILEKQEFENKKVISNIRKGLKTIPKEYFDNIERQKNSELEMEMKYLKELEIIENKHKKAEEDDSKKKIEIIKTMKEFLIKQIEEKKDLDKTNRFRIINEDRKKNVDLVNSINREKEEIVERKKKLVDDYKMYLDDQVKNIKEEEFMSEVEKKFNKKLLDKI